ncbi:conserved hypothetical protein [delta proteobacterium NaphS2]|nr:conserved hypothetical protein [delta proteobacterium NaphS2]
MNQSAKAHAFFYTLWTIIYFLPLANAHSGDFEAQIEKITERMRKGESAAVSPIYEEKSGDITALGDRWRTRVEACLSDHGVVVKTRKDLGLLQDEMEMFGSGARSILDHAEADVVATGTYVVEYRTVGSGKKPEIHLVIKALRVRDGTVVGTIIYREGLSAGWEHQASLKKGNVYHRGIEAIAPDARSQNRPEIKARMDRKPPCYPPGVPAVISVETEPGVHLYILGVAADYTVSLFYPNRRTRDQPLPSGTFRFPPPALAGDVQLVFYPLKQDELCHESIKIIVSRKPMDFSFLPIPEDHVYAGARGGDMKKVLEVLRTAHDWNEVVLSYWVGAGCE